MGCGCGRKPNKKTTVSKTVNVKLSNVKKPLTVKSPLLTVNNKKYIKCKKCPYSTSVNSNIGRCKKSNRLIDKIIKDTKSKCPIGRF